MTEDLMYTPTEIAKLLQATTDIEPDVDIVPIARRIIRQAPKVSVLLDILEREDGDDPSPMALARFLFSITSGDKEPRAQHIAVWILKQSEPGRKALETLEALAADAGMDLLYPSWPTDVIDRHRELDLLLRAEDWTDPLDVVDPIRDRFGEGFPEWIAICHTRIARGEGDVERLREVLRKLERSAALRTKTPTLDEEARKLREWFAGMGEPQSTTEMLERMAAGLRWLKNEDALVDGKHLLQRDLSK